MWTHFCRKGTIYTGKKERNKKNILLYQNLFDFYHTFWGFGQKETNT